MATPEYHVVGADHIDLAWKKGSREMAELQESFLVRLLDLLDTLPRFTYVVEQAAHFRGLATRRPDLIRRVQHYVEEGRLEVVGCMASTLETNMPCGEAFVRNQLLGTRWFQDNLHVAPQVGWLVDTFGVNPQVPQILRQFGVRYLMANRLGGEKHVDVFHAEGLDGSRVLVAGRDVFSAHIKEPRVHFRFTGSWNEIDRLFRDAEGLPGDGPFLVVPYMENEILPSIRIDQALETLRKTRPGARYSLPRDFFRSLEASGKRFPVEDGDLNPEFTGCFSQRIEERLANRRAEVQLLEAELWTAVAGLGDAKAKNLVDEAWWIMAFNHFHDVFTGSHPTSVMEEVLANVRDVERIAGELVRPVLGEPLDSLSATTGPDVTVVNSLPWARRHLVRIALEGPRRTLGVECEGKRVPSAVFDGRLCFLADLSSSAARSYRVVPGDTEASGEWKSVRSATIQNDAIRLDLDQETGIVSLVLKETGKAVLNGVGDFLTLQRDDGNFQYELPVGSEMYASACVMELGVSNRPGLWEKARLSGAFPPISGSSEETVRWTVEMTLAAGIRRLGVDIHVDWKARGCRLRLKVPTAIDTAGAVYEVPFGAVCRRAYSPGFNKKGEWPAQRFVAVEDSEHGLALLNTGVAGVEASGGTLWTTLLRAPTAEYAGMVPDETSSNHGPHDFWFALLPYRGSWGTSGVVRAAAELNSPPTLRKPPARRADLPSAIEISDPAVALAAVKIPEDARVTDMILRLYEATGVARSCTVTVAGARQAWMSDLPELAAQTLPCREGSIEVSLSAFQIVTIRVRREAGRS